ncbi:MAG: hypothetical protein AAF843_09330 [Bacteroidota bacterium]
MNLLIEHLELECFELKSRLNDCISDEDYSGAECYKEALLLANEKLKVFYNLRDPLYNETIDLKRQIQTLASIAYHTPRTERTYSESIDRRLRKLNEHLNERVKEKKSPTGPSKLDKFIRMLLSGMLNSLELAFHKSRVFIILQIKDTELNLTVKSLPGFSYQGFAGRQGIIELRKMGFRLNDSEATVSLPELDIANISFLKVLLSRIFFEVFRVYGNHNVELKATKKPGLN